MKRFSARFTQIFNRQHQLNGALFKGRYQASLIAEPALLPYCLNWLASKPTATTKNSKHSANLANLGCQYTLQHDAKAKSCDELQQQAADNAEIKVNLATLLAKKSWPALLDIGSNDHVDKQPPSLSKKLSSNQVVKLICQHWQVDSANVLSPMRKNKKLSQIRQIAMLLCHRHCQLPLTELAPVFGLGHFASLANRIAFIKTQLDQNPRLAAQVAQLDDSVRQLKTIQLH